MKKLTRRLVSLLLAAVMILDMVPVMAITAFAAEETASKPYKDKVISVMGDSISTYRGYIPAGNAVFYPALNVTDVNNMWWMQLITTLDAKLGVNESWSGSRVLNTLDSNSGNLGPDAAMASVTRIQKLAGNGTPDVIAFFGGTNDVAWDTESGSFDPATAPSQVDLTTTKWTNFADSYVAAIMRMQHFYPDAQIVAILPTINTHYYTDAKLEQYNSIMRSICDHYGVPYVDLAALGYTTAMLGDSTHPNVAGMTFIAEKTKEKLLSLHTHRYSANITAPTCTQQGYTTYTCECGDSYVSDYVEAAGHTYKNGICTICNTDHPNLANYKGKVVSVLGDSISTFAGYIPVADGYNLEHLARYPQDNLLTDVNETWWMQVITILGGKLGINDSWRGATVSGAKPVTTGTTGENAAMGNLQRLKNLGANGTPDLILFYGGTNDLAHVSEVGSFDAASAPSQVDLTTTKWDNLADGYVHTLLRLQHFYPDAQIIAMLPTYTNGYYSDEKLARGNAVLADICEHYGVTYIDLRECGISTANLPDNIHPDATGMDYISAAVIAAVLCSSEMTAGENTVHSVTHQLTGAESSLGYYKGVSAGKPFVTTLTGENLTVKVTMGGVDITDSVYSDNVVNIPSVTGNLAITATGKVKPVYEDHLQQLPDNTCSGTNLWKKLEHDRQYYTATGWGVHSSGQVYSVTFPVTEGDKIFATSFGKAGENGGSINGIRVTWFDENGLMESVSADKVYSEFAAGGYLTVPDGATVVSIPMWTVSDDNELYILNREHTYENGTCTGCDADHPNLANYKGKVVSILSASTSTFAGYIPEADGFNLAHRARYPQDNLLTDVNETWWMQLITVLDAKLGINDSWAGSQVLNTADTNSGDLGPDACMASLTRIQNLGANGTPDVILFFGAGNDMGRGVTLGSFDPDTAPDEVDLTAYKWDTFADAYVAAIMRLQHFYPDSEIIVMTTYAMPGYATAAKLAKYGPVIRAICDHYGVKYVDLQDSGVTFDMLPDNIHPDAEGMDYITADVLNTLLNDVEINAGENTVYSVTHSLNNAMASKNYYKGVSAGTAFKEIITGDNLTVKVTMAGTDITDSVCSDGTINIPAVTGDIVIQARAAFNADGHLQQLPENICCKTNLWKALEPENIYYTASGWGNTSAGTTWSITFPVNAGDKIWATSLGAYPDNGSSANGVRVTWFDEDGVLKSLDRTTVYSEFARNGYITAPEGAVALNLPMTNNQEHYAAYILNREHTYENGICTGCGDKKGAAISRADDQVYYDTLAEAMDSAQTGDTVKLLADTETFMTNLYQGITLDLNGYTLETDYFVAFNGNNIIDSSEDNSGLLVVAEDRFAIANNSQLPVKTTDGYKFYEVLKINEKAYTGDQYGKYVFQPIIEPAVHEQLLKGMEATNVQIIVDVTYKSGDDKTGKREFVYSDSFVETFVNSYNAETGKYSKMFTLTIGDASKFETLTFTTRVVFADKVEFASPLA